MKRAAHHLSNLTPLLNFVRISKWFELQQRAWWQMKALELQFLALFLFLKSVDSEGSYAFLKVQIYFCNRQEKSLRFSVSTSYQKKSLAHLKIVCYMTKTLKTPSPHMKVTRKNHLRIATHEGVQNLNLRLTPEQKKKNLFYIFCYFYRSKIKDCFQ